MAVVSGGRSASGTLTASTVETVILTAACKKITVLNVTGTTAIYFRVAHIGGSNPQPAVGDAVSYVLPAAIGSVDIRHAGQFGTVVNLISSGTPGYAVSITD